MATPRKRWFKQDDSILRDPWSREEKLAVVLLRAYLNTRVSRDGIPYRNAGRAHLSEGAVHDITGLCMQDGACLLASVGRKVGFRAALVGGFVAIEWPKFSKEQDYSSRSPGQSPGRHEPSDVPEADPLRSPLSALQDQEKKGSPLTPLQGGGAPNNGETPRRTRKRTAGEGKSEPPEAVQFAVDFAAGLAGAHEGIKPPTEAHLARWATQARLMLEADGRPLAEAQELARWLLSDPGADASWWRGNVLAVPKFRQEYDRLQAIRRRSVNGSHSTVRPGPLSQALRNIRARAERAEGT